MKICDYENECLDESMHNARAKTKENSCISSSIYIGSSGFECVNNML